MKTFLRAILLSMAVSGAAHAQTDSMDDMIKQGIELYDQGDYAGAVAKYEEALKLDKKNPVLNYELAMAYAAMNDLPNAIKYSEVVIKGKGVRPDLRAQAHGTKANSLDLQGKPDQAVKEYKKAIALAPDFYLLYFNLGLTLYNQQKYAEAEEALVKAVQLNSGHASSHLLLGYTKQSQGKRVQSLLALYNFLLLEPSSTRAADAYQELRKMQQQGVSQSGDKSINVNISLPKGEEDEFSAAEMMISLSQASAMTEKENGQTEEEAFYESSRLLFSILGELKKDKNSFWWNYYVDFFYNLVQSEHVEAMTYYISQSSGNETASAWLEEHPEKLDQLAAWYQDYNR
ncbi:tetratricopeptide repeat protein [Pontibacter korlensis]|uniref:Uncharacterized protein n=1 Tax=Pontibacter korlensis TaxID=400092 RepID=A0A0E3UVI9_9BACT|nr:tetratricopeptide repeat protein [Pontibacter korlensis]AKD01851.1 hypothetical protein PKOR_00145 [Pontibacter korlensis]